MNRFRLKVKHWARNVLKSTNTASLLRGWFTTLTTIHSFKPGQWTDDASMALCMADRCVFILPWTPFPETYIPLMHISLIAKVGFDGSDMRIRFWNWWCVFTSLWVDFHLFLHVSVGVSVQGAELQHGIWQRQSTVLWTDRCRPRREHQQVHLQLQSWRQTVVYFSEHRRSLCSITIILIYTTNYLYQKGKSARRPQS